MILALGGLTLVGCGEEGEKARREVSDAGRAVSDYTRTEIAKLRADWSRKLDAFGAEFETWRESAAARTENASAETKARWSTLLEKLEARREAAAERLEEVASAGEDELEDAKRAWSRSMEDLKAAFAEMKKEFDR
jgi:predicted YcjX-like family ATPase